MKREITVFSKKQKIQTDDYEFNTIQEFFDLEVQCYDFDIILLINHSSYDVNKQYDKEIKVIANYLDINTEQACKAVQVVEILDYDEKEVETESFCITYKTMTNDKKNKNVFSSTMHALNLENNCLYTSRVMKELNN